MVTENNGTEVTHVLFLSLYGLCVIIVFFFFIVNQLRSSRDAVLLEWDPPRALNPTYQELAL